MIAGVSEPGGEASIAFHKAMGFAVHGTLLNTGYKDGQWLSAVYLVHDMGEPADMELRR